MIPVLFDKTATEYETWGLGLIKDAQSAVVTEELGGDFTAELIIPYSSHIYPELEVDRIIVLWVPYRRYWRTETGKGDRNEGGKQPFRIVSISKPMKGLVTVKCEHVSAQTKRIIMSISGVVLCGMSVGIQARRLWRGSLSGAHERT